MALFLDFTHRLEKHLRDGMAPMPRSAPPMPHDQGPQGPPSAHLTLRAGFGLLVAAWVLAAVLSACVLCVKRRVSDQPAAAVYQPSEAGAMALVPVMAHEMTTANMSGV
jgi:hypothetical protein